MKSINRLRILFAIFDTSLVVMITLLTAYLHLGLSLNQEVKTFFWAFSTFPVLWLVLSVITRKFRIGERSTQREVFLSILFSNFTILSVTTIVMVLFQISYLSRFVLFGAVAGITLIEVLTGFVYVAIQNSIFLKDWIGLEIPEEQSWFITPPPHHEVLAAPRDYEALSLSISEESGTEACNWICGQIDITDTRNLIVSTNSRFNIINHPSNFFTGVVNLERINNIRRINKFFETVNSKLPFQGLFIGCAETYMLRKQRILEKFPPVLNWVVYTFDFLLNRVAPKLVITRKLYFLITRGKKRVISRTETLGRLFSCGFEIIEEKSIGDLLYFKVRKNKAPVISDDTNYGLLIRLPRIGKNGETFKVYKLRTMHVYAEYVQSYVYENNKLDEGGKFKNDFRVTTVGRIFRKLWLDELPMLINVLKGDMKPVGVRPLSLQFYNLYSEELKKKRIVGKPGLIPPYYAQYPTPVTLEDIQRNEMEYLTAYEKHPFRTDLKYFFKAMYYIFLKRARSK